MRGLSGIPVFVATVLVLAVIPPGAANPPPPPWLEAEIGDPGAAGSTDVDFSGLWTIKGSGENIFGTADSFHFAYQPVKGDASISARFLSMEGGDGEWARAGLMVREDDAPGSPNFNLAMTPGHGLLATRRPERDGATQNDVQAGPSKKLEPNLFMWLQRTGQEITAFYSRDGTLWTQAALPAQILPTLGKQAEFGLSVTAFLDGDLTVGKFDQVRVQTDAFLVTGLSSYAGDRSVLLQWHRLKNAIGYHIYRGPAGAARNQLVRISADQVPGTSFADSSLALVNGTSATYAVAAVFQRAGGGGVGTPTPGPADTPVEGPLVLYQATPVPPGFLGCSINEGGRPGAAVFDPATGVITLRGSGAGVDSLADGFYFLSQGVDFLSQAVEGDVQVTVEARAQPTLGSAGLMIRESLDAGARNVLIGLQGDGTIFSSTRNSSEGKTSPLPASTQGAFRRPLLLRLTRRGNTIIRQYSTDEGKTFGAAGPDIEFDPPLARELYVGLAITAGDSTATAQAQFANLRIQKL